MGVLCLFRRQVSQLEEGDVGTLHPIYQVTCQPWITFMANLGKLNVNLPLLSPGIEEPLTERLLVYLFFILPVSLTPSDTASENHRLPFHSAVHG